MQASIAVFGLFEKKLSSIHAWNLKDRNLNFCLFEQTSPDIMYKVYSKEFLMQISSLYNVLDCNLALKGLLRRRGLKIAQDKTLMKEIGSLMQLVEIFSQVDLPSNS